MSKTRTGSPKLGVVPKSFKRLQNKSLKMKLKQNVRSMVKDNDGLGALRIRKTHRWNYF
jgi:hypothetical protein